jgi:predicted neuraminidase
MKPIILVVIALVACCGGAVGAQPFHQAELIFPLENFHNHASCIVQCPNGDLLACWYRGVGPEKGDDVAIWGARKLKDEATWRTRFIMADTPGYPDDNPCMFVDPQERLWLLWPTLLANKWETAVMKYRISSDYQKPDAPPVWAWQDIIHVTPAQFEKDVAAGIERFTAQYPELVKAAGDRAATYINEMKTRAADPLQQRLGWMTRVHPTLLPSGRLIVPLYTDAYSVSIMAMTDDWGQHWITSQALVGLGNIQPSVVRKNDGALVAMMRENGMTRRIRISESKDNGMTWGPVASMGLPNPGSGLEVIRLANGHWALIYNDTEQDRYSLAVSISDDEGKTWKWTRHLEKWTPAQGISASYPSIMQAKDGTLDATYSYSDPKGQSIKHAAFNEEWVMRGDGG